MQEILLIFACVSGKGCSETTSTYAHYNKTSVEQLETTAKAVERRISGAYTPYLLAVYSAYTSKAIVLTVNRHTNMEISHENVRVSYNIEY